MFFQGFDGHGRPILELFFRVQYYVDQVVLLRWAHFKISRTYR